VAGAAWRRIAGFRVVVSWPQAGYAPPPTMPAARILRARLAGIAGAALITAGVVAVGIAAAAQVHAPQPPRSAAGITGSPARGLWLPRSLPVSVQIPAIGVHSRLLHLGLNSDGTVQVPSLTTSSGEAAWYKYSATPGQIGSSVIEGHVDSQQGPAVFFRLGALRPGDTIDVTLADGITAIFRVTGVREYAKSRFPAKAIYGATDFAALRLITCGGTFDYASGHYLSSTVVFASLTSSRPAQLQQIGPGQPVVRGRAEDGQGLLVRRHDDARGDARRDAPPVRPEKPPQPART
jgi:Sortase domain